MVCFRYCGVTVFSSVEPELRTDGESELSTLAISAFFPSFSLHICFRLCWLSIRQVRNVGMDRRSILLVTHHKQYFKEKQRTFRRGRNLMTVTYRLHLKRQHLMTRIQPFLYTVHSKMSLRSSRWNMTNKCRSCSVIPSTMCTSKVRQHYGFLP